MADVIKNVLKIAHSLQKTIKRCGTPKKIYIDNGKTDKHYTPEHNAYSPICKRSERAD